MNGLRRKSTVEQIISMNESLDNFVSTSTVQPIVVQTKRHEIYKFNATDQ